MPLLFCCAGVIAGLVTSNPSLSILFMKNNCKTRYKSVYL
jgi:hypothetical protein